MSYSKQFTYDDVAANHTSTVDDLSLLADMRIKTAKLQLAELQSTPKAPFSTIKSFSQTNILCTL